ncbi:HipA domain-containing protein [Chryseobacterium jejuense]|uniref:HipA domain-containing protein n=1 Tax=Chryseobacterium jejuense TaxID=445960 RepID=UPI001AEB3540|nr:HipA domain-containing protein [Chryseobacterium jejuense]MBP2614909.1 hypothetical protein [Chryseobacterium jejuense]
MIFNLFQNLKQLKINKHFINIVFYTSKNNYFWFMIDKKLRLETSISNSGEIFNLNKIQILKNKNYYIRDIPLDGDAPKQFIFMYEYIKNSKLKKKKLETWTPYIAKTAEKWYPHESIIEFAINRIGDILCLKMNEVRLVIANNQIRFLSKFFLNSEEEVLVHAADICGEYIGNLDEARSIANNRKMARELFTFEFVKDAIRNVFPDEFEYIMLEFVKMLTFDAIVGNNDRHFYNWGIIRNIKNTKNSVIFAPIYDSARGLLWNFDEANIERYLINYDRDKGTLIDKYLKNSCPRISIEDDKSINHFELIKFLWNYNDEFKSIIDKLVNDEMENKIINLLEKEIFIYFSEQRKKIIRIIIKERFQKLKSKLC